jgi:hypothetical protein
MSITNNNRKVADGTTNIDRGDADRFVAQEAPSGQRRPVRLRNGDVAMFPLPTTRPSAMLPLNPHGRGGTDGH